ncbi:MAG: hypothetical protein GX428_12630 [Candidatus Atribacteria bacterium]|nr:hypothetical protein [Candidatus Atribacteria bacterium]
MERPVIYYDQTGPENTELTLQAARKRALDLGISKLIVASTYRDTFLVVKPSYAKNFYDFEICEIVTKPRIPKEK